MIDNENTLGKRLRYKFDSFMTKGGVRVFASLMAVFVIIFIGICVLRVVLMAIFPDVGNHHDNDAMTHMYITFLELTDPGNMAQDIDSSAWYKIFGVVAGIAGIIMLSALIAFITTGLDQKIHELKRGHSKVIEKDHTLILGWNEQRIIEVLKELIMANESEDDACVVILAEKDKEDMDDVLRVRLKDRGTTRIVTRSGSVTSLSNLAVVSAVSCRAAIVLAGCEDSEVTMGKSASDAKVIQTILALTTIVGAEFCIVAEIFNQRHRAIVQQTFKERVVTVNTNDILAKILVQTSRSVGLSTVYNEVLSFAGCEMYFYGTEWGDITFGEMAFHFPDGVPMAVRTSAGELLMNPPCDRKMNSEDEILILADDDSTIDFEAKPLKLPRDFPANDRRQNQHKEKELIIGWTDKAAIILSEYADYVLDGSQVDIMLKNPTEEIVQEIMALKEELSGITINILKMDPLDVEQLLEIKPFTYDNIIILADGETEAETSLVDSENLVTLLLLRNIFEDHPEESLHTKLITEVLDSQNYQLVSHAGVKDVVISNRLISMILAQISESGDIIRVYDDIFEEDGSEIYLKPASLYFDQFPVEVAFADLMGVAQKRGEVCLGVKIKSKESDTSQNCGIQLIPEKSAVFTLCKDDALVVLSEDES